MIISQGGSLDDRERLDESRQERPRHVTQAESPEASTAGDTLDLNIEALVPLKIIIAGPLPGISSFFRHPSITVIGPFPVSLAPAVHDDNYVSPIT
jgi:hypothetical protein